MLYGTYQPEEIVLYREKYFSTNTNNSVHYVFNNFHLFASTSKVNQKYLALNSYSLIQIIVLDLHLINLTILHFFKFLSRGTIFAIIASQNIILEVNGVFQNYITGILKNRWVLCALWKSYSRKYYEMEQFDSLLLFYYNEHFIFHNLLIHWKKGANFIRYFLSVVNNLL